MASFESVRVDMEAEYKVTAFLYESPNEDLATTSTVRYSEYSYNVVEEEPREQDIYANATCTYMHEAYPNVSCLVLK